MRPRLAIASGAVASGISQQPLGAVEMSDLTTVQKQRRAILLPWLLVPATAVGVLVTGILSGTPGNYPFAYVAYSTEVGLLYLLLPLLLFYATGFTLVIPRDTLPPMSVALFAALVFASVWYFRVAWNFGQRYQGPAVVLLFIYINVGFAVGLAALGYRAVRQPTFSRSLWFHFLVVLWAATTAFPYFGEVL